MLNTCANTVLPISGVLTVTSLLKGPLPAIVPAAMMAMYVVYGRALMVRKVEFGECWKFSPVSTAVTLIK